MCTITATEFKKNFGKYNQLAQTEVIEVTHRGKVIYSLVPEIQKQLERMYSFVGMVPEDATIGTDPDERL